MYVCFEQKNKRKWSKTKEQNHGRVCQISAHFNLRGFCCQIWWIKWKCMARRLKKRHNLFKGCYDAWTKVVCLSMPRLDGNWNFLFIFQFPYKLPVVSMKSLKTTDQLPDSTDNNAQTWHAADLKTKKNGIFVEWESVEWRNRVKTIEPDPASDTAGAASHGPSGRPTGWLAMVVNCSPATIDTPVETVRATPPTAPMAISFIVTTSSTLLLPRQARDFCDT